MQTEQQKHPIVFWLTTAVTVTMLGHGIGIPIFAGALTDVGGNTHSLAIMFIAFSITQAVFGPLGNQLVNRVGTKVLFGIAFMMAGTANLLFTLASDPQHFIWLRMVQGAAVGILFPIALSVADAAAGEHRRARTSGIISAGFAAGFAIGPMLGGILFDLFGTAVPFTVAALLNWLILIPAVRALPKQPQLPTIVVNEQTAHTTPHLKITGYLLVLLMLDVLVAFPLAFIEPELIFFASDTLRLTATQFGLLLGAYGITQVFGQFAFGGLSDSVGRKVPILAGFMLNTVFFIVLAMAGSYPMLLGSAVLSGLGQALIIPALTAAYLDTAAEHDRNAVMGIKQTAMGIGYALGPALILMLTGRISSEVIFAMASALPILAIIVTLPFTFCPTNQRDNSASLPSYCLSQSV